MAGVAEPLHRLTNLCLLEFLTSPPDATGACIQCIIVRYTSEQQLATPINVMNITHLEDYGSDYSGARKRSAEKARAGHRAEHFPYEIDGVTQWRVRWDTDYKPETFVGAE